MPYIIEVDDSGNVVTEKRFNNLFYDSGDIISSTNDGGYIIWGVSDTVIAGNYQYPRYFAKLDSNLNTRWQTTFSETTIKDFYNIRQMKDSSYVCVGFHADPITGSAFGWIAKTDENGHILWQHDYYKRQDYDNYMADVQQTPDKGYIITGTAWDSMPNPSQDIWLIRLDSNGCVIPGCDTAVTGIVEINGNKTELKIFPNPAASEVTITYNIPLQDHEGRLSLFTLDGRELLSKTIDADQHQMVLNLERLASGVYLLQYRTSEEIITKKLIKR